MPDNPRRKIDAIYNLVGGWYQANPAQSQKNPERDSIEKAPAQVGGGVLYVAHAITGTDNSPVAHCLADAIDSQDIPGTANQPLNHPDQYYWRQSVARIGNVINRIGIANIIRIEIDCSLMPCSENDRSCLYRVPILIQAVNSGLNKPLRIYSHRDESMGGANTSSKRVIFCNSNDTRANLEAAYNGHQGWSWSIN